MINVNGINKKNNNKKENNSQNNENNSMNITKKSVKKIHRHQQMATNNHVRIPCNDHDFDTRPGETQRDGRAREGGS